MAKKNNTGKTDLGSRIKLLEQRVTKLETQLEKKLNRRKREYTDEDKKASRYPRAEPVELCPSGY